MAENFSKINFSITHYEDGTIEVSTDTSFEIGIEVLLNAIASLIANEIIEGMEVGKIAFILKQIEDTFSSGMIQQLAIKKSNQRKNETLKGETENGN